MILVQSPKTRTPDLSKTRKSPVLPDNKSPREKPNDEDKKKVYLQQAGIKVRQNVYSLLSNC